jgi:hypothetical protein
MGIWDTAPDSRRRLKGAHLRVPTSRRPTGSWTDDLVILRINLSSHRLSFKGTLRGAFGPSCSREGYCKSTVGFSTY